jgi:hypothetical protein
VVEFARFATKLIVEPVNAITINIIGNITTRTRVTSKNAAIVERDRFSRHRFINGLKTIYIVYITKKKNFFFFFIEINDNIHVLYRRKNFPSEYFCKKLLKYFFIYIPFLRIRIRFKLTND